MSKDLTIHVFITRNHKIRAKVKEGKDAPYEVTVGGMMWKLGKGKKHQTNIREKSLRLINNIATEFEKHLK